MRCAVALLFTLVALRAEAQQVTAARLESGVVNLRRGEQREQLTLPCTPTSVLLRARLLIGCADGTLLELDVRGTPRLISVTSLRGTITQLDVKRGEVLVTVSDPTPLSFEEAYRPDEDANEKARRLEVVAPSRLGSWLGITVASLLPFNVTDGGGLGALFSLVVEWHAAAPFALRANLSPVGGFVFFAPRREPIGSYGGDFEAQLDLRAFGLGAGVAFARGDDAVIFNFTQSLRLGALDGLNLIARTGFRFDGQYPLARLEASISIPLGKPQLVLHGAMRSDDSRLKWIADIGLRLPVGSARTVFLTPSLAVILPGLAPGESPWPSLGFAVETRR